MKPAQYQIDAANHVFERDHSMVLAKMGTGKTLAYLMAMQDWIETGAVKRILVTGPLRVVKNVWRQEREKWKIPLTMALLTGEMPSDQRVASLTAKTDVLLVNNDMVDRVLESDEHGCDAIVFDELSKWRNPTGKRARLVRRDASFRIRSGGTGTPAPNSFTSLYGMCHTIGIGQQLFGKNYDKWLRKYFYPTDFNQYNWAPFPNTCAELAAIIKPYTYVLENNPELPPIVRPPIELELPWQLRGIYNRLRATSELSDHDIIAGSAGVLRNKLRQIASGFIYNREGDAIGFDRFRLQYVRDVVEEMNGEPILIAYEYREQLAMMLDEWPDMRYLGGGSPWDDEETLKLWNQGKLDKLGMHPASAGHGLNMQDGGNTIVWWNLPDDLELYDQMLGRLVRRGQTGAAVWSYEPVAANTVEIAQRDMAASKSRTQDELWAELRK